MSRIRVILAVFAVCPCAIAADNRSPISPAPEDADAKSGLERAVREYQAAFNHADANAVARLWVPDGVYMNRETGESAVGRDAIHTDMTALFKAHSKARLAIHPERLHVIRPDVVRVDGETELLLEGEPPDRQGFSAIYVKHDGQWFIDHAEEFELLRPLNARTALRELDWMVGRWVDQSEDAHVETDVRWAPGRSFLIRSYIIETAETSDRGTQVIGWDPIRHQIRSWTFDADGAFGEGLWSRSGEDWLVRMTFTTSAGDVVSGTQVITRMGSGRVKVQTVGQEVNGEPQPSKEPILAVRVADQPTRQPPETPQGVQR